MNIIYEDKQLLVIDKPAGLPILPDGWQKDADYLVRNLEEKYGRIFIVHRLDKVTSGVVVFARDDDTHRALNTQFEQRRAAKSYHALLSGVPKWGEKTARHPLRSNVGHKHRSVVDDRRGKPAETHFKVLKRYHSRDLQEVLDASLVEARPVTGRTHQIRVHAYAVGHPLLGDTLYSGPSTAIIGRPALHAHSLIIEVEGKLRTFKAPYPDDFREALQRLKG